MGQEMIAHPQRNQATATEIRGRGLLVGNKRAGLPS